MLSHRSFASCLILVGAGLPGPLIGQETPEPPVARDTTADETPAVLSDGEDTEGWFPSSFVVQPIAGNASGVDIGAGPIFARRDIPAGSGTTSPEADVSFGYRVPVYRFSNGGADGPALDLGIEAGMLARFALGEGHNGLINSDFRIAFPVGADFGDWEGGISLVHVSSHAGDDFIEQTPGFEPGASSRNGVETLLMYRKDSSLRLYAGGDYNFAAAGVETVAGRLGVAFDPPAADGPRFRPIGTLELEMTDFNPGVGVTGTVGVAIRAGPSDLRLGLIGHAGPSEMGQFREYDEEYIGLFLGFVPNVVVRSGTGEG